MSTLWYQVRTRTTSDVVEATHWLDAIQRSTSRHELVTGELAAEMRPNGVVRVREVTGAGRWIVRRLDPARIEDLGLVLSAASDEANEETAEVDPASMQALLSAVKARPRRGLRSETAFSEVPRVAIEAPSFDPTDVAELDGEPDTTSEDDPLMGFFEAAAPIAEARTEAAAIERALDVLTELTGAELVVVWVLDPTLTALTVAGIRGPKTAELPVGGLPLGTGLAGWCFGRVQALIVDDATRSEHPQSAHIHEAALVAPIVDVEGGCRGVVEAFHASRPFGPRHLEGAREVARALATWWRMREGWRRP